MLAEARRILDADPTKAAALARRVLAARPGDAAARLMLGAALRRGGDASAALGVLTPLAAEQPGAWGVQHERGLALAALGDLDGAAAAQAMAVRANPAAGAARHALAVALHRLDRSAEALAAVEPLVAADAQAIAPRALRAAIRMQLGDAAGTILDYRVALAGAPDDARLWLGLGHALKAAGPVADAVAAYRAALAIAPGFGEAWWSLANLKTWAFGDDDVAALRAALVEARPSAPSPPGEPSRTESGEGRGVSPNETRAPERSTPPRPSPLSAARGGEGVERAHIGLGDGSGREEGSDRAYLYFAFGKAFEDARDFAASFDAYARGNALRRAALPYDADAASAFIGRIVATFDADFLAARAGWGAAAADPIFIVGMPRSGSTLVEQILGCHSAVEGLSELPDLPAVARGLAGGAYPEALADLPRKAFTQAGEDYLARARPRRRTARPFFVDKLPGNFLHAGLIHLILPNARIVDVRRDALGCGVSLFKQAFAGGQEYSYDLGDIGRAYTDYVRLIANFEAVLPGRILRVDYAALVDDPESATRRLLAHCGLAFEPACLRFFESDRVVRTPSAQQVRRPIDRSGLDHWRNFEPWLGPLEAALGDLR